MSKSAILSVRIIADAAKAKAGFDDAEKQVGSFTSTIDKMAPTVDKAAGYATAAAAAYGAFAYDAMQSASELEQANGAVASVFKEQAGQIDELAKGASKSVGLAESQYKEMAAVMGSQLGNMGIAQGEVAGTTENLIGLGADLASMFGGTTSDAVGALSSLLRGERDPIERYAVSLKQADIDARLAADGLDKLEGEAKKQAETQATLALLFEQTADAQGNFARETDTAAGSAQIAAAEWENAKAALGEQFLPVAVQAAEWAGKLAEKIGENPEIFRDLGIAIGIATGALMGISGTIKVIQGAETAFKIFNATLNANPIMRVVSVVSLLAAGLVYAYQECETFRNIVDTAGAFIVDRLKLIGEWISAVALLFTDPGEAVKRMADIATRELERVQGWLKTAKEWVGNLADSADGPGRIMAQHLESAIGVIERFVGWLKTAWEWVGNLASKWGGGGGFRGGNFPPVNAAAADPDMTMEMARAEILKFSANIPDMTMQAYQPDITAARADSIARGGGSGPRAGGQTIINQVTITGTVIDKEGTAREIKKLLDDEARRQGL